MLFKIIAKSYELFLRAFRPVHIHYFCQVFPTRPYSDDRAEDSSSKLHIFIPFRDRWELTRQCLESLTRQNKSQLHIRIHLIDNGSGAETRKAAQDWVHNDRSGLEYTSYFIEEPFNFSKLCNIALKSEMPNDTNDTYLFLNNDVVLDDPHTLVQTTSFVRDNSDCGALGITLLFPDQTIQHLFAAPGVKIVAAHPFKGRSPSILLEWNTAARRVPAVTGAFLMTRASLFRSIGGFDENLPTTGQDIDLCLKLQQQGYGNWVLPKLQATHYESASRKKSGINKAEVDYIYSKWRDGLTQNAEYPSKISRWSEQPVLKLCEGRYPYQFII